MLSLLAAILMLATLLSPGAGASGTPPAYRGVASTMPLIVTPLAGAPPVDPVSDPSVVGQWAAPIAWPMVGMHMTLMGNGKLLSWQDGATPNVYDPATGIFTSVPTARTNIWCAGHAVLGDGRVVVMGGDANKDTVIFDPATNTWFQAAQMFDGRFYPTETILPDGRVLTMAGAGTPDTPEIYDPLANTDVQLTTAARPIPFYPFNFVIPDGRVVDAGSSEHATDTEVLDMTTGTWSVVDPRIIDGGSAVQYAPGKILKAGTATDASIPGNSANTAYVLDMNQPNPQWRQVGSMAFARSFLNLTALPDGEVIATGGDSTTLGENPATGVLAAEIWNPATEQWSTLSSMSRARLYHSTGILMPDGRVMVSGSGDNPPTPDELTSEFFSPPYLFKGARPVVSSSPATVGYGSNFLVGTPDAASIASVTLIRPGSVTHSTNMNQHSVPVSFTQTSGGLIVQAPASANLAPPGDYMLFIVNGNGVPSVAPFVRVQASSGSTPTPTPTITPGGSTLTPTPTSTATPTRTNTPPATPTGAAGQFGNTASNGTDDSGDAGYLVGSPATLSTSGTLTSLSVYIAATQANAHVRLALYASDASNNPGALVASTQLVGATAGWVTVPLGPIALPPGVYWILSQTDNTGTVYRFSTGLSASNYVGWASFAFGSFPPVPGAWYKESGKAYSMYGTVSSGSTPAAILGGVDQSRAADVAPVRATAARRDRTYGAVFGIAVLIAASAAGRWVRLRRGALDER